MHLVTPSSYRSLMARDAAGIATFIVGYPQTIHEAMDQMAQCVESIPERDLMSMRMLWMMRTSFCMTLMNDV